VRSASEGRDRRFEAAGRSVRFTRRKFRRLEAITLQLPPQYFLPFRGLVIGPRQFAQGAAISGEAVSMFMYTVN
jgi:hypothetical protein